jgi:hypothetical protein
VAPHHDEVGPALASDLPDGVHRARVTEHPLGAHADRGGSRIGDARHEQAGEQPIHGESMDHACEWPVKAP